MVSPRIRERERGAAPRSLPPSLRWGSTRVAGALLAACGRGSRPCDLPHGALGRRHLTFWTNPSDEPDLEDELRRRGAEHIDTVAVFARPIDGEAAAAAPPNGAIAELVTDLDQIRAVDAINVAVWEQLALDDEGLRAEFDELTASLESRTHGRVLARIAGQPVSTGGWTLADGFARLWGAATLEDHRGRGAYRAVLSERLRIAAQWGAMTALVKGRVSTSAPIIARAGFEHYGDERAYRLIVG